MGTIDLGVMISDLIKTEPTLYELKLQRMCVLDCNVNPLLEEKFNLMEIIEKIKNLPYIGVWSMEMLRDTMLIRNKSVIRTTGELCLMVNSGVTPSIVLRPRSGTFWGLKNEEFDPEYMQMKAAVVLKTMAGNFPQFVTYTERYSPIPEDLYRKLEEEKDVWES